MSYYERQGNNMKTEREAAKILLDGGEITVTVFQTLKTTFEMKLSDVGEDDDLEMAAWKLAIDTDDWHEEDSEVHYS